jgi:hypothetical protein
VLVGLDFDNTIVCYDTLFHRLAAERGLLSDAIPATKKAVRDHLVRNGAEAAWTELQGIGYGPRIVEAAPFAGMKDFLRSCRNAHVAVAIISHKTRQPYLGQAHDLHAAAHAFLHTHGFYDTDTTGLTPASVYLELTKEAKLKRIGNLSCDVFVDDLPEILTDSSFPVRPLKVLFDPACTQSAGGPYVRCRSWLEVTDLILAPRSKAT